MKTFFLTLALALPAVSGVSAASLDRIGLGVGDSTFIPAVRFVSPQTGAVVVTTETFLNGHAAPAGVVVLPAGAFNPTRQASAIAWARDYFGQVVDYSHGADVNSVSYDDCGNRIVERDHDNW